VSRGIPILLLLAALLAACGSKTSASKAPTNRALPVGAASVATSAATATAVATPASTATVGGSVIIQDIVGSHPLELALTIKNSADVVFTPNAIAIDKQGRIYVGDSSSSEGGTILMFDAAGKFLARLPGKYGDGDGQFNYITSLALDSQGNLYATDFENLRVQKFNSSGTFLAKIATEAPVGPVGVAVDTQGNIYVTNHRTHDHYVQKFDSAGHLSVAWGSNGSGDGQFLGAGNNGPDQIALGPHGNVYVTDPLNSRIQKFDPNGTFLAAIGSHGDQPGQFSQGPYGLAVDTQGNIYASDLAGSIQKFDSSGHVLSKWRVGGQSRLVEVDAEGNIYIKNFPESSVEKFRQR